MIPAPCRSRSRTPLLAVRCAADDPEALAAALACGPDALVLEGVFPPDLRARSASVMLILALDGPDAPLPAWAPDAILLGARSGRDVAALGARLAVHEAEGGWPDGSLRILAEIGDPLGVLDARSFVGASPRLTGLGLDEVALAAALGAGAAGAALAQTRGQIRLAAAAAGVGAILTGGSEAPEGIVANARSNGFGLLIARDARTGAMLRAAIGRDCRGAD